MARCQRRQYSILCSVMSRETILQQYYQAMFDELGPSNWWPGDSPFEIAVGAILTQNTNWQNVEKAISRLKEVDVLSPEEMTHLTDDELERLIHPAGFYKVKTRRLRALLAWLNDECGYDFTALQERGLEEIRASLLSVKGVGPETADSILLYAAGHPSFVVDAYTRRIFSRHGLVPEDIPYEELRDFFMDVLPAQISMYNEYHALIVRIGKNWCRPKPKCDSCPLRSLLTQEVAY